MKRRTSGASGRAAGRGATTGSDRAWSSGCRDAGALRRPCGSEAGAVQERSEPCCAVLRAERTWTRCRQERGAVQGAGLGRSGRFHRRRTQKFAKCRSNTRAEGQREQAHGLCRRTAGAYRLARERSRGADRCGSAHEASRAEKTRGPRPKAVSESHAATLARPEAAKVTHAGGTSITN